MTFKRGEVVIIPPGNYRGAMAGHDRRIFCDVPGKIYKEIPDNDGEVIVEIDEYGIYKAHYDRLKKIKEKELTFEF